MSNWQAGEPHNALPALSETLPIDIAALSQALVAARVALAKLDQASFTLANPMMLINAIAIVEAQASSAIENIVTTNGELFQNMDATSLPSSSDTRAVMRNRSALQTAYRLALSRPITANLAADICSELLGFQVTLRASRGTFIGSRTKRVYTPPEGKELLALKLDEWTAFVNTTTSLDPLVVLALSHYQFEAIHPFADGNGRTGRILNIAYLVQTGLLRLPIVHLSRVINANRNEYYTRLERVTSHQEWTEWIAFILRVIEESSLIALGQIQELTSLEDQLTRNFAGTVFRSGVSNALAKTLFEKPYCKIGDVTQRCNVSRPTAAKWLEELEILGYLESVLIGRDKYFINHGMLRVLG